MISPFFARPPPFPPHFALSGSLFLWLPSETRLEGPHPHPAIPPVARIILSNCRGPPPTSTTNLLSFLSSSFLRPHLAHIYLLTAPLASNWQEGSLRGAINLFTSVLSCYWRHTSICIDNRVSATEHLFEKKKRLWKNLYESIFLFISAKS